MKSRFTLLSIFALAAVSVGGRAEAGDEICGKVPGKLVHLAAKELMNCAGLGNQGLSIREEVPYHVHWRGLFTCVREGAGQKFRAAGYDVSYRWTTHEATGGEVSMSIETYGDLGCLFMSKATRIR